MKIKLQQSLLLSLTFLFVGILGVSAQKAPLQAVQKLQDDKLVQDFTVNELRGTPGLVKINPQSEKQITKDKSAQLIRDIVGMSNDVTITMDKELESKNNIIVQRFQQYYRGIKVEHGSYAVLNNSGVVKALNMEHYDIPSTTRTSASLSEEAALEYAIAHVGATEYAWDYYNTLKLNITDPAQLSEIDATIDMIFPKGELVLVDDYTEEGIQLNLAYKFNVYAAEPLYRADLYVDAATGKILLQDLDIKHAKEANEKSKEEERMSTFAMVMPAVGTAQTRYAGTQSFINTFEEGNGVTTVDRYTLNAIVNVTLTEGGVPVVKPIESETRSFDGQGGAPVGAGTSIPSYEITDGSSRPEEGQTVVEVADNNWTLEEHYRDDFSGANGYPVDNEADNDDVGTDAHWGTEVVLKYWAEVHNRWSWDGVGGKVNSFVHYGDAYDNAFFSGGNMVYGDGSSQGGTNPGLATFLPLMSLDVCGHEIGHGVCSTTSNLVYSNQSGGLNEGFSDIWAATVENYVMTNTAEFPGDYNYLPWGIGEQIDGRDNGTDPGTNDPNLRALRWMDFPKAEGNPDCFEGGNWTNTNQNCNAANDGCGVHNNSGVLNKWFYLLVEGSGQTFDAGRNKPAADDSMNDNQQAYEVMGIGFEDAEQITFITETMLSSNATYPETRMVSIEVAADLYGIGSDQEVATTNAWHATCVGEKYVAPDEVNYAFFQTTNEGSQIERNSDIGCNTSRTYTYGISHVLVAPAATITLDLSASTATLGEDFDISTETLTLEGSGVETFDIIVYDDALVDADEFISISFTLNDVTETQNIMLIDDEVVPTVGESTITLIETETFDSNDVPENWDAYQIVETGLNEWAFNGTGAAAGTAYITDGTTTTPKYEGNGPDISMDGTSNAYLVTPLINANGLRDINVSFDWQAGGEDEAGNPLDFGELMYSYDGTTFFGVEKFVSPASAIAVGTYDAVIPELTNTQFYVAFRWFNDQLLGTAFSFTVDNVTITGEPALVETAASTSVSNTMRTGDDVYFFTDQNNNIVARIDSPSADLGCVAINVVSEGTDVVANDAPPVNRSSKVITIEPDGPNAATATYNLTLYYTADELANFDDVSALSIMKVEGNDITAATNANTVIAGGVDSNFIETENYATFKGTFTGFSSFAISEDRVLGANDFEIGTVSLYPSPVSAGEAVTITTKDLLITNASVYDVRGARVLSKDFDSVDNAQLSTSGLQSGFYFVRLNNDTNKTFKFIVK